MNLFGFSNKRRKVSPSAPAISSSAPLAPLASSSLAPLASSAPLALAPLAPLASSSSPQQNSTFDTKLTKIQKQCAKGNVDKLDTCTLNNNGLKFFALTQTILEIYDADHDLNRSKYDKNPLVEYCKSFEKFPKVVFINDRVIDLDDNDLLYIHSDDRWRSTSQSAIKNSMETILKGLDTQFLSTFGRIPFTSSITSENKQLTDLQVSLKKKKIDLTLVETHRGGQPDNSVQDISIMLKPSVSTRFDLGSIAIPIIENTGIQPDFCSLNNNSNAYNFNTRGPTSPLCRFFSNYFPNSFTIVIKKSELTKDGLEQIFSEMGNYFKKFRFNPKIVAENLHAKIEAKKESVFFQDKGDNDTYLLHMFMDSAKKNPTFSIQKGPITADQVTNELYGVRHRCLSAKTQVKSIEETLLILDADITPNVRFCHILYAKTCGDGVAIEATKMASKVFEITVNLLSNDVCCNYRNAFVNGFSTRQAPSSFAGTGFGILSDKRNVEIMTMINPTTTTLSQCIVKIINEYEKSQDIEPLESSIKKNELIIDGIDQSALDDILTCAYRKIYNDEYNDDTKTKQSEIIKLIKNLNEVENLVINEKNCDLLKELCMNPQILFIKTKVDNSFENFKNRLKNILKKIQIDYPTLIQSRVSGDDQIAFTIERGISLVSSLEQLLGEVYPCDLDELGLNELGLKKMVLYFLTVVIRISIIPAKKIIGRYIEMLKITLIRIFNKQVVSSPIPITQLDINPSYTVLLTEFNTLFNKFALDYQNNPDELDRYNRRQEAKQPLNLLKFILRSIEANNKWANNNDINLYQYIKKNYHHIITDSNVASPSATQQIESLSQQIDSLSQQIDESYSDLNHVFDDIANEKTIKTAHAEEEGIITDVTATDTKTEIITHDTAEDEKPTTKTAAEEENKKKELEKKIEELENSDSNISGFTTENSPEDTYYIKPSSTTPTPPTTPPRQRTGKYLYNYEYEDDLSVAIAPAPDGDTLMIDISDEQKDELEETIEIKHQEISVGNNDDDNNGDTTTMSLGGKPSRKTKNKRNKITRNKKSKNNQTKKRKRTKRRKVF